MPYRATKGSEQGFPCVLFPHREKPVFITGFPGDGNRFFPVGKSTQGKPCCYYRDGFAVKSTVKWKSQFGPLDGTEAKNHSPPPIL